MLPKSEWDEVEKRDGFFRRLVEYSEREGQLSEIMRARLTDAIQGNPARDKDETGEMDNPNLRFFSGKVGQKLTVVSGDMAIVGKLARWEAENTYGGFTRMVLEFIPEEIRPADGEDPPFTQNQRQDIEGALRDIERQIKTLGIYDRALTPIIRELNRARVALGMAPIPPEVKAKPDVKIEVDNEPVKRMQDEIERARESVGDPQVAREMREVAKRLQILSETPKDSYGDLPLYVLQDIYNTVAQIDQALQKISTPDKASAKQVGRMLSLVRAYMKLINDYDDMFGDRDKRLALRRQQDKRVKELVKAILDTWPEPAARRSPPIESKIIQCAKLATGLMRRKLVGEPVSEANAPIALERWLMEIIEEEPGNGKEDLIQATAKTALMEFRLSQDDQLSPTSRGEHVAWFTTAMVKMGQRVGVEIPIQVAAEAAEPQNGGPGQDGPGQQPTEPRGARRAQADPAVGRAPKDRRNRKARDV